MANPAYKRVSTDQQSTARQNFVLAEAGIEDPVVLDMPGKVAEFLRAAELEPVERGALDQGVTVRRGQGYTLRISTTPEDRQLLARCQPLDGTQGAPTVSAQGKARREYENRVSSFRPAAAGT